MEHIIKIYDLLSQQKDKDFLKNVILPNQTHSNNIVEIKTGNENLENCDGLISSNKNNFALAIKTADCACICFYDKEKYGIIHAGWRWLVNGIIEKMLDKFESPKIFVWPLLNKFEIQKDDCYQQIKDKFWTKFFEIQKENWKEKIIFNFLEAIKLVLPKNTKFDGRNTFTHTDLASWRRDKNQKRNYTIIKPKI